MTHHPRIAALIVAAGTGSRAGGDLPKQYQRVAGVPMLAYAMRALIAHPAIAALQVVIHAEHPQHYAAVIEGVARVQSPEFSEKDAAGASRLLSIQQRTTNNEQQITCSLLPPVIGGATRAESVAAGLAALAEHAPHYVLIHDAARPFLSHTMIDTLIAALDPEHGVVPALAVADTLRRVEGDAWHEVPRDGLMRMQTPQGFPFATLKEVVSKEVASKEEESSVESRESNEKGEYPAPGTQPRTTTFPTDDAATWLAAGGRLRYVMGDEELRKVTTPDDIAWADAYARRATRIAIGMGYDVHALMPAGDAGVMRLGGIDIPCAHKLHGHSDADVVLHAIVDALLGAIAAGDIGSFFPPTDAKWKGANSAIFVEEARAQVAARGGVISHLDITIIGEQPKISPHREAMRAAIAAMLHLPLSQVSVKATTTEKLGFTGRGEGIACQAVATVMLPMESR